jgi:hypothetical protein
MGRATSCQRSCDSIRQPYLLMSRVVVTRRSNASVPDMHVVMPICYALRVYVARLEPTPPLEILHDG